MTNRIWRVEALRKVRLTMMMTDDVRLFVCFGVLKESIDHYSSQNNEAPFLPLPPLFSFSLFHFLKQMVSTQCIHLLLRDNLIQTSNETCINRKSEGLSLYLFI